MADAYGLKGSGPVMAIRPQGVLKVSASVQLTKAWKLRSCLACRKPFNSPSPFIRICPLCKSKIGDGHGIRVVRSTIEDVFDGDD